MTFKRHFGPDVMHMRDDGRTIEGRIVPYGEVAEVVDIHPVANRLMRYREQFLERSFTRTIQYAQRRGNAGFIALNFDHDEANFYARIGYATELDEKDDGVYATFRLYEGKDLEKVQSMLRESHSGLSVKFADIKEPKLIDDVVSHVQVALEHVAATPLPTYEGASILAMRSEDQLAVQLTTDTPNLNEVKAWLAEMRAG